jgi:hypothetical protein
MGQKAWWPHGGAATIVRSDGTVEIMDPVDPASRKRRPVGQRPSKVIELLVEAEIDLRGITGRSRLPESLGGRMTSTRLAELSGAALPERGGHPKVSPEVGWLIGQGQIVDFCASKVAEQFQIGRSRAWETIFKQPWMLEAAGGMKITHQDSAQNYLISHRLEAEAALRENGKKGGRPEKPKGPCLSSKFRPSRTPKKLARASASERN